MKDVQDTYHRNMMLVLILGACLTISLIASLVMGIKAAALLFLGLSVVGVVVALVIHLFMKGSANVAGGLFLGSKRKDDKAIIRGMYQQANGLKLSANFAQAETVYRQILADYPDQLEAHYLLAQMLWLETDRSKEALKMFQALQKKIQQKNLSFKYKQALKDSIQEIREELIPKS